MSSTRPAPTLDIKKYFTFHYGCDSGLIYPREYDEAIQQVLDSGVQSEKVFRGARDKTDVYDDLIPSSYVKVTKEMEKYPSGNEYETENYEAQGYKRVWCEDRHALPRELVEDRKKRLDEEKQKAREGRKSIENDKRLKIFEAAKQTGQRQILEQYSQECDGSTEECDIDNVHTYAMPDGSIKTERSHTW